MVTKTVRKTRCGGCGQSMTPHKARDTQGRSWHYECLVNSMGSSAARFEAQWAANKAKRRAKARAKIKGGK